MKTVLLPDFSTKGFASMDLNISRADIFQLYHQFDKVCDLVKDQYDLVASKVDQIIEDFISNSHTSLANKTLKLKYLNVDEEKYRLKSFGSQNFRIFSYQYLDGLYEHIKKSGIDLEGEVIDFLRNIDFFHQSIKGKMPDFLEFVSEKEPCVTLLKIWRHTAVDGNSFLLPMHFDRTIFTIILNTKNSQEECLRMYPPGSSVEEPKPPFQPKESDFPIIFPGRFAKELFSLEPTLHSVVAPTEKQKLQVRYSLVLFVARQAGW